MLVQIKMKRHSLLHHQDVKDDGSGDGGFAVSLSQPLFLISLAASHNKPVVLVFLVIFIVII
jgi:hypothetical protein